MGTDIEGWVEYALPGPRSNEKDWYAVIRVGSLASRNYDLFGCLFGVGVRNYAHFRPIAAGRGLPPDASSEMQEEYEKYAQFRLSGEDFAYTWITWQEIKQIDWEEEAEEPDERPNVYEREENGELTWLRKGAVLRELSEEAWQTLRAGKTWEQEDQIFKLEKMKRKEALDGDWEWQLLFDMMALLAKAYGDENVRMVVHFSV